MTCELCIMCAAALSIIGNTLWLCNDKFGGCGSILSLHQVAPRNELVMEILDQVHPKCS
ncbi:hypothetical protein BT93_L2933 [Corymbia citriodora subsp. variegata]|uniref:Uncharacterized protein n=1 Tax=Corymbia citriodora subsp. variegata TaxID=360336 RepID=A0A8T0CVX6_CORYI|nr:hypothetical protein BT93_L2933 [Corymbia citriodora subsp. variegata]